MPAPVTLLVRKFIDGDRQYRNSIRPSIEEHPNRDDIVNQIETAGFNFKAGTRKRKKQNG